MPSRYQPLVDAALFPRAAWYAGAGAGGRWRESGARARLFPWSERHLQIVWHDNALRPGRLATADGEPVEIEDPGAWNLEAGPDFLGAAVRVGAERRRLAGDVEVHIHPSAWSAHGHGADPRYRRVRLHVTFFPGRLPADALPPGAVQIALRDALAADPAFSFDNLDLTAYPYALRAPAPPCRLELLHWSGPAKQTVLDAAGEERLRRKAERMALLIAERGRAEAVYEETLAALGYKQNRAPFRRLARALPCAELRERAAGDPAAAFALLAGTAGLLPDTADPRWDAETASFFRTVWRAWWRQAADLGPRALPRPAWQLAGVRPANHPLRRLMAAAVLFGGARTPDEDWIEEAQRRPARCLERVVGSLVSLRGPYFDRRAVFGGRAGRPAALVGRERAEALAVNVFAPLLAAAGEAGALRQGLLDALPSEADNAILRLAALNVLGPDHPPSLCRGGLRRQGLLQIFHDFCLNDRSRCAACPFPGHLRRHRLRAADGAADPA